MKDLNPVTNNFVLFTAPDGQVKLDVFVQDETVWLTQKMQAELFDVGINTVNYHLKEVFDSAELEESATIRKFRIVQKEGNREVSREIDYYNLDAIIAVGYRVNSKRATQFRIWATKVLKEYMIKGFAMNDERLKMGERTFGKDYFEELLDRIRSIRASERRIYLQITDIFAECSTDYDPKSLMTRDFFATVQNKFHYAITGHTAAEIIHAKADKSLPHMGLSVWKGGSKGRILSSDVTVAKNYLSLAEIRRLERTISGFFDYIENVIENKRSFTMKEFVGSVDKFLSFNEYKVLGGKGTVSQKVAEKKALKEYDQFNLVQPIESDFEREMKKVLGKHD